jgi:hypothetical protein
MGSDLAGSRRFIDPILSEEMGMIPDNWLDSPVLKKQVQKIRYGFSSASHENFLPCDLPGQSSSGFLNCPPKSRLSQA